MITQAQSELFRGRFEIKMDPKFRLILPSVFREVLSSHSDSRMVVTNSQYQGKRCLDVYPIRHWKRLENRIAKLPQLKVEVQNFQRFYLSGGHPIETDAQGRVLIPPSLRTYANLQGDIVIVGFANKFEIWSAEIWKGLFENLAEDFNQTLAAISNLEESEVND
jgi:MraZ protein